MGERERKQEYRENVDTFSIRSRTNTGEGVAVVGEYELLKIYQYDNYIEISIPIINTHFRKVIDLWKE